MNISTALGAILIAAALIVGVSALLALPVYWLWNALVPDLFHGPQLTFIQSWGLGILTSCLFKSHGGTSK